MEVSIQETVDVDLRLAILRTLRFCVSAVCIVLQFISKKVIFNA